MARCNDSDSCKKPAYYRLLFLSTVVGSQSVEDHEHSPCHPNLQATIQESDEDRAPKCCNMDLRVEQSTRVRVAESSRNRC
ncbi:hypothetical protein D5086_023350 [Populus alba]|uniref:Uncharacterized protein n=1 Tax=Populus alba TaxID=43335 RepID=A0ACC4B9H5_POPAL